MKRFIMIAMILSGCSYAGCCGGPPYYIYIEDHVDERGQGAILRAMDVLNEEAGCELFIESGEHGANWNARQYKDRLCHGLWSPTECAIWIGDGSVCDDWNCFQIAVHEMLHGIGLGHDEPERFPRSIMKPSIDYRDWLEHHHLMALARKCGEI